jgi:hypothetical protein
MTLLLTFLFGVTALSAHPYECDAKNAKHFKSHKGTNVSGGQYFNELWDADGSPYRLTKNTKIGKGATITVGPGAVVIGNGFRLDVDGILSVKGGEDDPALLLDVNIAFGHTRIGEINISYARIEGGSLLDQKLHHGNTKGKITLEDSFVTGAPPIYVYMPHSECIIDRNVFSRTGGISVGTDGVEVFIRNNVFHKQTSEFAISNWARYGLAIPGEETADGKPQWYPMDMVVRFNSFLCSDKVALRLEPQYNDARMEMAKDNFFGMTDEDAIAKMIYDKSVDSYSNRIRYKPVLDEPHEDTPYTPELVCQELTPKDKRERRERRKQFMAFADCDEKTADKFLTNSMWDPAKAMQQWFKKKAALVAAEEKE